MPKAKNVYEFEEFENSDDETGSYIANEDENCSDEVQKARNKVQKMMNVWMNVSRGI